MGGFVEVVFVAHVIVADAAFYWAGLTKKGAIVKPVLNTLNKVTGAILEGIETTYIALKDAQEERGGGGGGGGGGSGGGEPPPDTSIGYLSGDQVVELYEKRLFPNLKQRGYPDFSIFGVEIGPGLVFQPIAVDPIDTDPIPIPGYDPSLQLGANARRGKMSVGRLETMGIGTDAVQVEEGTFVVDVVPAEARMIEQLYNIKIMSIDEWQYQKGQRFPGWRNRANSIWNPISNRLRAVWRYRRSRRVG